MLVLRVARRFDHTAHGVKHAHGIGAPRLAKVGCRGQGLCESIVAHSEILGAMVKAAKAGRTRRHAATGAAALFKDGDAVSCLHQGARAGNARHASANDGEILNGFCHGICFCHAATLHAMIGLEQCLSCSVLTQLGQPPT